MFRLSDFLASVRRETDLEQQKKPFALGGAEVDAMEATARNALESSKQPLPGTPVALAR
jgi:hypothetical protein